MSVALDLDPVRRPHALAERAARLKAEAPGLRARDLAERLGASEGELVACRCDGVQVTRLRPDWQAFLQGLTTLGPVMALTRNTAAVHEKTGAYAQVSLSDHVGLVLNDDIDLRLFPKRWRHLFAVVEEVQSGRRRSLQLFDAAGLALHKVYERIGVDPAPFDALVATLRADDQAPGIETEAVPAEDPAPETIDVTAFRAEWDALTDTHQFFGLLRRHGLTGDRPRALALAGAERAAPVGRDALRRVLESAAASGLPIMVFVGNPGVIQIHTGPVKRVEPRGPWINVLDPGFNLHLREDLIDTSWVVRKPTADGTVTSLELFMADGTAIAALFGKRKPGVPEDLDWRALAESLTEAAA